MLYKEPNALQIRVTLSEIEPAVWRRLVVPWTWRLGSFISPSKLPSTGGTITCTNPELLEEDSFPDSPRVFDEREVRLLDFDRGGATFSYLYDFGDCWRHTIEIEQGWRLCGGRPRASPEDVGGVDGCERFLVTMADRDDPKHAEMKQWCGGYFNPEWFDLTLTDKDVRNALGANVRRRLHQPKPRRSIPAS
jgi:hypothetical protein